MSYETLIKRTYMRYAEVNGERVEAGKGARGICPHCHESVIAKCGSRKVHHWAHKSKKNCDLWWENKTEWHYSWQDCFPKDWQEVTFTSSTGERHIADIHTPHGLTVEFQHSFINLEEQRSREAFYEDEANGRKMIWVVNGTRLSKDVERFVDEVRFISKFYGNVFRCSPRMFNPNWGSSTVPVFFDFGDVSRDEVTGKGLIWGLLPWKRSVRDREETFCVRLDKEGFISSISSGSILNSLRDLKYQITFIPPQPDLLTYLLNRRRGRFRYKFYR